MDGLSILAALTAFNNRSTEAFKIWLRDNTPVSDDLRRLLTVLFSMAVGIVSMMVVLFNGVSFAGTWLEPFSSNLLILAFLGGTSVSLISGVVQPIIERLEPPATVEVTIEEEKTVTAQA